MISIPISILELAVVNKGSDARAAINNSMQVAQYADTLDYKRIWFAEHHNMPRIASAATSLLIQLAAAQTRYIRVGSGGIMLPNHSPLIIAEQFGTLETLYPGRIDLGLGRAPGTDQLTAQALRRTPIQNAQNFPQEVMELQNYFQPRDAAAKVHAFPGEGLHIPIWILGSSTDSAYLAAEMGLPYAFATHFAPAQFAAAANIYKARFKPSEANATPYMMACVNVIMADTDEKAAWLATSYYNMIISIITGQTQEGLTPPGDLAPASTLPEIRRAIESMTAYAFIGSKEKAARQLEAFIAQTGIDELMITSHIYDMDAKLRSFELVSELIKV
jgi:luciferase family oxidoreductase group 1